MCLFSLCVCVCVCPRADRATQPELMELHDLYNSARHTRPADALISDMTSKRLALHESNKAPLADNMPEVVLELQRRGQEWGQGYQIMSQRGADEVGMGTLSTHTHTHTHIYTYLGGDWQAM